MNKKLLLVLPVIFSLASCGEAGVDVFKPYQETRDGVPALVRDTSGHVTYLRMSPFGSLNIDGAPVKGEVSSKFYENTIIWEAAAGTALPTKEQVESSVRGASFTGWAYYDPDHSDVVPDYYTTVPEANGTPLYAMFTGTDASDDTPTGYGLMFGDGTYRVAQPADEFEGFKQYVISNVSFKEGVTVQLYNFDEEVGWIVGINTASFDGNVSSYLTDKDDTHWVAMQDFTCSSVYIKLKYQQDEVYFGL